MNTTSKIDKSKLMKRAWRIYRGTSEYSYSFSASLKRAWQVEKENAVYRSEAAEPTRQPDRPDYDINLSMAMMANTILAYYASGSGRNFGD